MNCNKCNAILPENAKYCHKCGKETKIDDKIISESERLQSTNGLQERKISFTSKNPETTKALMLGVGACLIMLIRSGLFFSLILVIFDARALLKAKKTNENKKYINYSYFVVYVPVLLWLLNSIDFAMTAISNAR